jgi:uncharacterized protein
MNFELLKETKIRYLLMEMLGVLGISLIILIVCGIIFNLNITDGDVEVYSLIITVLWFMLVLKFMKKNDLTISNFLAKPTHGGYVLEVPINLIITYLGSLGLILLMLFLIKQVDPEILSSVQSNLSDKPEDLNTAAILIISFIYSVIAAPVVEEFIFRGILMGRLYNKYGIGKAILFSSIIFFIMHLTINPMILLLGISCALLAYKYKSIIPSIALHACNNLLVFVTGLDKSSSGSNPLNINTSVTIAGIILLLIYAFYSYLNYKKCRSML